MPYFFFRTLVITNPMRQGSQDGRVDGYAAFKVANTVKEHACTGFGSNAVFTGTDGNVNKKNAFEVPNAPNVKIEKMVVTRFSGPGNILNVINGTGESTAGGAKRVALYNNNADGTQPYDEVFDLPNKVSWPAYIIME